MKLMPSKTVLILFLLFSGLPNIAGQSQAMEGNKLTKEQFEKIGPLIVCKLTYAYILDCQSFKPWIQCEKTGTKNFSTLIDTNTDSPDLLTKAEDFIKDSKNCWHGSGRIIFVRYKAIYDTAVDNGSYELAQFKNQSRNTTPTNYNLIFQELKVEIGKLTNTSSNEVALSTSGNRETQNNESVEVETDSGNYKGQGTGDDDNNISLLGKILSIWYCVVIAVLIFALIFMIKNKLSLAKQKQSYLDTIKQLEKENKGSLSNQNVKGIVDHLKRESLELKDRNKGLDQENKMLRDDLDNAKLDKQYPDHNLKKENEALLAKLAIAKKEVKAKSRIENSNSELQVQNKELKEKVSRLLQDLKIANQAIIELKSNEASKERNETKSLVLEHEEPRIEKTSLKKTIYLPFAYDENHFNAGDQVDIPEKDSFFRVVLDPDENKGDIFIYNNPDLLPIALSSAASVISPICESLSSPKKEHTNITTIEPGRVSLWKSDWILTQKIKIVYG